MNGNMYAEKTKYILRCGSETGLLNFLSFGSSVESDVGYAEFIRSLADESSSSVVKNGDFNKFAAAEVFKFFLKELENRPYKKNRLSGISAGDEHSAYFAGRAAAAVCEFARRGRDRLEDEDKKLFIEAARSAPATRTAFLEIWGNVSYKFLRDEEMETEYGIAASRAVSGRPASYEDPETAVTNMLSACVSPDALDAETESCFSERIPALAALRRAWSPARQKMPQHSVNTPPHAAGVGGAPEKSMASEVSSGAQPRMMV